jgi:uncharacterized membrane protein YoaK (UPF0700 family)
MKPGVHSDRRSRRLAALVALLTGYVDGYAFVAYGTFVSFMSGNTTQMGASLAHGVFARALPPAVAILGFVIGHVGGTLLAASDMHSGSRRAFAAVAALLSVVLVAFQAHSSGIAIIAALSIAMGILNCVVTHVGAQSIHTGFVTGTLASMSRHLAAASTETGGHAHLARARLLLGVWCAFFIGAVLGGVATYDLGSWAPLPPAAVLVALVCVE